MKCDNFADRLNELLDERLSPQDDASLLAHADQCGDCRETLAAQETLFRGLAVLQRRSVSPEIGRRVLAEVVMPVPSIATIPPPRFERRWLPMLVSAAAVLLAVSFGIWIANRGNNRPVVVEPGQPRGANREGLATIVKPGIGRSSNAPAPQPAEVVKAPMPAIPAVDEHQVARLAMASIASHWPTTAQWPHMETLDVEHYAPGIRPIRESFEVALEALMRTIPGKKDARPTPPQAMQPYGAALDIA